jgi:hypothetical protein
MARRDWGKCAGWRANWAESPHSQRDPPFAGLDENEDEERAHQQNEGENEAFKHGGGLN